MNYCPKCGKPVQADHAFCPSCGCAIQQNQTINTIQNLNVPERKHSAMSIVAFVLSLSFVFSSVAVILAVVDLIINKKNKHGLSIAALVIGLVLSGVMVNRLQQPYSRKTSSVATRTASTETREPQSTPNGSKATETAAPEPTLVVDTKETFIASCTSVAYSDVERSPDNYQGKNIRIEGTVVQVSEGWFDTAKYRIATDANGSDDVWYVTYTRSSDEERILKNDRVIIYGVCDGLETYQSVLGSSVTIPALNAKYIEVLNASEADYTVRVLKFNIEKETYGNDYEYYAIVEIQNTGDSNIYIKKASFDLEDSAGHLIQTDDYYVYIFRNIIKPGEVGYLYTAHPIDMKSSVDPNDVVLVPQFTAKATFVTLREYEVSDVTVSKGTYGISCTGRITNNTNKDESYLYLRVAYYDANKNILGISGKSITGLDAGQTISFDISSWLTGTDFTIDDIAYYEVLAAETYYGS